MALGTSDRPDESFEVEFARSRLKVMVPPGKSILLVAEEQGIHAPYSCREGTCGTCETRILAGRADHRDFITPLEEGAGIDSLMI